MSMVIIVNFTNSFIAKHAVEIRVIMTWTINPLPPFQKRKK